MEHWRAVVGFEGLYEVSSLGRVRGLDRVVGGNRWQRGMMLACTPGSQGYPMVHLRRAGGGGRSLLVHRLVLDAFVGPRPAGSECRHIDGVQTNNALTNLAWGSRRENLEDNVRNGVNLSGELHPGAKLAERQVISIRARSFAGEDSAKLAAEFGVTRGTINDICRGDSWRSAGGPVRRVTR